MDEGWEGQWEKEQMRKIIDYEKLEIDAAPLQVVEQTSLVKVRRYIEESSTDIIC